MFKILCWLMFLCLSCSDTSFTSSANGKRSNNTNNTTNRRVSDDQKSQTTYGYDDDFLSDATDTLTGTYTEIKPDQIVEGMEVINDCNRCLERAKQLSSKIGFKASARKTFNCGFYKINESQGLCDIHFMQDMNDAIADHEGRDSLLDNQIAMYCPCTCNWAADQCGNY